MPNKVKIPRTPAKKPVQAKPQTLVEEVVVVEESVIVQVKRIIQSKTIWVNVLAILSVVLEKKIGIPLDPETQLAILSVINIVLRLMTHKKIVWK